MMGGSTATLELVDYHRRCALEYERIYEKPERQADLAALREWVQRELTGHEVLKNFPFSLRLLDSVRGLSLQAQITELPYYWCLSYRASPEHQRAANLANEGRVMGKKQ